ncbi:phosphoribosyltransferase-like protein [Dyella silvatica]|uniref:phosphoribosyltransferase-like protein n=1 Tax=Dyella silvatica TaxID=2992128 RepID=UPI00224FE933|nr:hypothetical protein [Dyella silvatica]
MSTQIDVWNLSQKYSRHSIYLRGLYESLAIQLYNQYEPTRHHSNRVSRNFLNRLDDWLGCFDKESHKWAAFRSLEYLFFAGQSEFDELYRHVTENVIKRWLVDIANIDIFSRGYSRQLDQELTGCWLCPATDSLRINGFLHISGLTGKSPRPDWMSLAEFGSKEKIQKFVQKEKISSLVILEDFVGSGGQFVEALKFAASVFSGPILAVPLIVCAPGNTKILSAIKTHKLKNVRYEPGLIVSETCLIQKKPVQGQPKLFEELRSAMKVGYKKIARPMDGEEYGWKGTGSLVVLYSNCPNNTPPMYHASGIAWKPIFPRRARV